MRIVFLNVPGRLPTVVPEIGRWWNRLDASGQHDLAVFGLNHAWWRALCDPGIVGTLAAASGFADIADLFGPRGSTVASASAAAAGLSALSSIETFRTERAYRNAIAGIVRHLDNLESAQSEFALGFGAGPVVRGVDYADSAAIVRFAATPSILRATIATALAGLPAGAGFIAVRVASEFELLTAAIAADVLRARGETAHICLIDHGYENFSLEPHIDALRATGALAQAFDSVISSKDDIDDLVPDLVRQVARGERPRSFQVATPEQRLPVAAAESTGVAPAFPTFSPFPVPHVRTSARRCYWSRCTFCTQNSKYADTGAPIKSDVVASVDRLAAWVKAGVDNIILADEAISPAALKILAEEILRRGLKIRWTCRCKLERTFSRELLALAAAAGCYEILFGLETISPDLLRRMGKHVDGLDAGGVARIFADMSELGIGIHVNLISGFPGESLAEAGDTVDFVVRCLRRHRNATWLLNRFTLFAATPMADDPRAFGIERIASPGDMPSSYPYAFDADTRGRTAPVVQRYASLQRRLARDLGWDASLRDRCGREIMGLYAGSGHSAVFKTLPANPLDPVTTRPERSAPPRRRPLHVFLTGGTGNAGHAIKQALLARGDTVTMLVRDPTQADDRCRAVVGDLRDLGDLSEALDAVDAIIHCASPRSQDQRAVVEAEIGGAAGLVEAWRRGPLIAMSSQTVYGTPRKPLVEGARVGAENWYDFGKLTIESMIAMEAHKGQRGAGVSLRLPLVFGSGPRRRDGQFLPTVHDALLEGKTFVFDDENAMARYGTVYIGDDDLGEAARAAIGVRRSGPYNVATGFATWGELIDTLGGLLGVRPRYGVRAGSAAMDGEFRLPQSRSEYDCRKFERTTGFAPVQTLETVLRRFLVAEGAGAARRSATAAA